jgi:hypothetical protein
MVFCAGCVWQVPFDREKWNEKEGHYHLRESMVGDVMKNHLRRGMTYGEVVSLLGSGGYFQPPMDSLERKYEVAVDYSWSDIDPVGGVDLHIVYSPDSLVGDVHLHYWGKRQKTD